MYMYIYSDGIFKECLNSAYFCVKNIYGEWHERHQ